MLFTTSRTSAFSLLNLANSKSKERFHSRGQQLCKLIGTKESFCIMKKVELLHCFGTPIVVLTLDPPSIKYVSFIYLFIYLPAFPDTGLPRGNAHERDSQVPGEVPSPPNPTTRKGWPLHLDLRPLLFSKSDVGSFTSHKNKSVKVL